MFGHTGLGMLICRIESVCSSYIYARLGVPTHAFSALPTITAQPFPSSGGESDRRAGVRCRDTAPTLMQYSTRPVLRCLAEQMIYLREASERVQHCGSGSAAVWSPWAFLVPNCFWSACCPGELGLGLMIFLRRSEEQARFRPSLHACMAGHAG